MMKPRLSHSPAALRKSLILLTVLLASCAPATSTAAPAQPAANSPTVALPSATSTAETLLKATVSPAQTLAPTPFPVVTSRGSHLEATDPKTVSMTHPGLQFVEFFEFW